MSKNNIFIFTWVFYLFWILINNITQNLNITLYIFSIIVLISALFFYLKRRYINILLLSLIGFLLWAYISDFNYSNIQKKLDYVSLINKNSTFNVEIKYLDSIKDYKQVYIGKIKKINGKTLNKNINTQIYINGSDKLNKGEIIEFKSNIYNFENYWNFEYKKYMYSKNIYFKTTPYTYKKSWINKNIITNNIYIFREKILSDIKKIYPYEESLFLSGILLWARENIPEYLSNNFNNSWLTHIIAISWFNITILILFFWYVVSPFPWKIRLVLISIIISAFTILVWYNPPVIRAAIMWIIWYFILISWRKWNTMSIILFTIILMSSISPLSINYDISFQLSFLSVMWILYLEKYITNLLNFIPNYLEIRTSLSITLSALISTLPIIVFNFWKLSIVSPISNLIVWWTIPIIMLFSIIGIMVYNIIPIAWIIISFFPWILLKWDIFIAMFLWSLKYSNIKIDFWKLWILLGIWFFIILLAIIIHKIKKVEVKN